jgi:hypothetical protein
VATITMSEASSSPLESVASGVAPGVSRLPTTPLRIRSSAPKRSAWRPAFRESSAPPIGSSKPKKFSIAEV